MVNVNKIVGVMAVASLGAVIVKEFVAAANLSGSAGTIAALFTFLVVGAAALFAVGGFSKV